MAVAHVQNWTGVYSTSGSATISGTAVTAGNWLVAGVRYASGGSVDVVPSPFTSVFSRDNSPSGATVLEVFIGKAVGGETSFEFGDSGAAMAVVLGEFTNILATSPTDVSASSEAGSATSATTGTTAETAQADALAVAFMVSSGGIFSSPSCATDFTLGSTATGLRAAMAWKILSATGTQAGTWSWTTSAVTATGILVLKGLAASGGGNGSAQWTEQRRR